MRLPMLSMEMIKIRNPAMIMAGKPTAKMFKLGAARVTTPSPTLMNRSETITGNAIKTAPRKTIELHCKTRP